MSYLKTLTFTVVADRNRSPAERRRMAMIERLQEQLTALTHPDYARTKRVWVGAGDQRRREDLRVPVKPWWRLGPDGKVVLSLRHGMKKIEFEKGKAAIAVGGMDDLPKVLQGLIDAVGRGELDQLMAPEGRQKPPMKRAG